MRRRAPCWAKRSIACSGAEWRRPVEPGGMKLRDQAYQRFTHGLLAREIRAGQFVSQRELVAITGMPLGAIRELIPRLEADGLIRTVPQRGMQVAQVDVDLIRNAFQFRLIIEREAAASFAENAQEAEFDRLEAAHAAVVAAATKGVTPALIAKAQATDDGLHATIVDALSNEIVSNAYRINSIKIRLIRQAQTRLDAHLVVPVMQEHLKIIAALRTRDPVQAAAAIGEHITAARNRALGLPPSEALDTAASRRATGAPAATTTHRASPRGNRGGAR
jgi:DNA-binding GntR family transcriptional regulator